MMESWLGFCPNPARLLNGQIWLTRLADKPLPGWDTDLGCINFYKKHDYHGIECCKHRRNKHETYGRSH